LQSITTYHTMTLGTLSILPISFTIIHKGEIKNKL